MKKSTGQRFSNLYWVQLQELRDINEQRREVEAVHKSRTAALNTSVEQLYKEVSEENPQKAFLIDDGKRVLTLRHITDTDVKINVFELEQS